jgi:hypothetical protein
MAIFWVVIFAIFFRGEGFIIIIIIVLAISKIGFSQWRG